MNLYNNSVEQNGILGTYKGQVILNDPLSICKKYPPFAPEVRIAILFV